jgi:hypothetical protein
MGFVLSLNFLLLVPSGRAEEPPAARKARQKTSLNRTAELEQRIQKLEAELASARAALKAEQPHQPAARFQMLSAGKRVVVLDTHTGETRIVEPETGRTYQNVEVGNAWFVVTVLGNLSEHIHTSAQDERKNEREP